MRLLPREEKFFALLSSQVAVISEASRLLLDGVRAGNHRMAEVGRGITELERKGDEIIHDMFTRLNQTFITPLDPEDLHNLAARLDDVLDGIEEASHRLVAYRVEPIPPAVVKLAEIIDSCAASLTQAFSAMANETSILEHCIEINRLENDADLVVRGAVAQLFDTETDVPRLIKLKELYEYLEATTDSCEDVADVLQAVVVKNS